MPVDDVGATKDEVTGDGTSGVHVGDVIRVAEGAKLTGVRSSSSNDELGELLRFQIADDMLHPLPLSVPPRPS